MDWVLTIKEEYIEKMLKGIKLYEIRTRIPKELKTNDRIFVCKPKTSGKIIAIFEVSSIYKCGKIGAWEMKKWWLGIEKEKYYKYVFNKQIVYLIGIKKIKVVQEHLFVKELGLKKAPQWFAKVKRQRKNFF